MIPTKCSFEILWFTIKRKNDVHKIFNLAFSYVNIHYLFINTKLSKKQNITVKIYIELCACAIHFSLKKITVVLN